MKISKFGILFLLLALRIDKHIKGYVDFYFGPENLRKIVDNESLTSPKKLLLDSKTLLKQLGSQGYDKKRERYLEKMLIAMRTSVELLSRIEISFKEQFLRLYDVDLQPVNESELDNLKEEYNEAYSGPGSLEKRMTDLRVRRTVPEGKVFELFKKALNITRERTKELFFNLLPQKERIVLELAKNNDKAKWSYYNWYMGNFCSRIEVNPNYNIYWTGLLSSAAHEGYPGHHTEFAIKERVLYRELNQFEHSILLLHSPKLILSEGIAELALKMLFSNREAVEISLRELCPDSSNEDSLEIMMAQNKVKGKLTLFWYNFAYHALIDKYNDEQLIRYGTNFEIVSKETIKIQLKKISNPVYSKNAFMYNLGSNLIKYKYGKLPSVKNFQNLITNPHLPSDLI